MKGKKTRLWQVISYGRQAVLSTPPRLSIRTMSSADDIARKQCRNRRSVGKDAKVC